MSEQTHENESDSMTSPVRAAVDQAQRETGHLVDSLVREGEKLRDQALKMTEEKSGKIKGWVGEARGRLGDIKDKTSSTLDSLEQLFEERVARALTRLGVPTRDELQVIAKRLEGINKRIQAIANQRKVAVMTARTEGEKDDLKMINGIGPALEGKLNAAGFCAYRQIVNLTDADVNRLEAEVIHLRGRIHRDDWIGQAKALHVRKYGDEAL